LLVIDCSNPIAFYSTTPDQSKPGKVHFIAAGGAHTTIAVFKENCECKGIHRVSFFAPSVDQIIYVPYGKFLTFHAFAQTSFYSGGTLGVRIAGGVYSVPFESGELRVTLVPKSDNLFTKIERLDPIIGWIPVQGVINREASQPFFETGAWCTPTPGIE